MVEQHNAAVAAKTSAEELKDCTGLKTTLIRITHRFNDALVLHSLTEMLNAHGLPVETVEIIEEEAA